MMISSSNRSPSPMKQNPNTNPNSRINQEKEGVGVRKSFQGYPFSKSSITASPRSLIPNTPANSPAECARRSSVGRECGIHFQDNEQKENDSDLNQKTGLRVRPPFIAKGTKNFMSPTISAVSKINPSPRKKVLGERNESIRTSASLSEGKFHFFSDNLSEFDDENEPKENMVTPPRYKISDSNKETEEKAAELDTDLVLSPELPLNATKSSDTLPLDDMSKVVCDDTLGLDVKNTDCSSSSITPLHTDPSSLPPYDPKTNLLSPRPQFLYYKPNPRIENYINQGIKFEDDFTSDSVSETENSEEIQSQASSSSSSVGTSCLEEKSSSFELTSSEVEELEEPAKPKIEARLWFGAKWKVVTFILLMLLGGMSLSWFYPGVGNVVYHEMTNSQIYRNPSLAARVSRENLNDAFRNIKVWSAQYVGYSYSFQMFTKKRVVKFSPLPVNNFTVWQEQVEDYLVKDHFQLRPSFDSNEKLQSRPSKPSEESKVDDYVYATEKVEQTSSSLLPFSDVTEHIETEEQDEVAIVEDYMIEEFEREILRESDVLKEGVVEDEELDVETIVESSLFNEPEVEDITSAFQNESQLDFEVEDQHPSSIADESISEPQTLEVESQLTIAGESISEPKAPEVLSQPTTTNEPISEGKSTLSIAVVSLVVISLSTAALFKLIKKRKNEALLIKPASKNEPKVHENVPSSSLNGAVEVDMVGESCPSEYSSFQNTSSYNKNSKGNEEAQSIERRSKHKYKKVSHAASSDYAMTSSYGSFTTYYTISHSKEGDEEVVTPVRRSNRIRNKLTSPSQDSIASK